YKHLAECPDGITHPFSPTKEPFGLCPTDPASLAFLASLYDQLLPHFSSQRFNVGMDETFDLGRGRSAHACTHQSKERVYLDFLKQVHALVSERGRRMQFWGDIILCQPALIPELPADAIAMEWGYEANHPFAEDCRHFAEAGLDFYVCPGTSSWNSIAGRTDNMLGNLMNAAQNGVLTGAIGLLNTDWGDHGHLQPLPISYAGFLAGAGVSWNTNTDLFAIDLPALLDRFVFRDSSGVMGKLAYDLGNVYRHVGYVPENGSLLFYSLVLDADPAMIPEEAQVTANTFARAVQRIDDILAPLDTAQMARPDAAWIKDEFAWAGALLRCACRLNQARLENPAGTGITTLPEAVRGALASELQTLIDRHRALWLRRNRPGGLVDSANRFQRLLSLLEV
ncbi:MAG: family 20 glycosylhydrolase, partial [Anaerolineae bacterium]|nr:family 20 glycosylhydrolase [Anaerolineae bacterium]